MSSEPDPFTATPIPFLSENMPPRPYAAQGRLAEEAIASAGRMLEQILGDAPLLSLLAARGVESTHVQRGAALHALAQQSWEECQILFGSLAVAEESRAVALAAARQEYSDFRRAVKAACANDSVRDPLDPDATPRQSLRGFVVQATASYLAGLKTLPPALIAEHGFALARTNAALARLQRVVVLDTLFNTRARQATRSARARDRAVERLTLWTRELLEVVQMALGQPRPAGAPALQRSKRSAAGRKPSASYEHHSIPSHPSRFALRFLGTPRRSS